MLPPLLPPELEGEPPEELPPELDGFDGLEELDDEGEGIWQAPRTIVRAIALVNLSTGPTGVDLISAIINILSNSWALARHTGICRVPLRRYHFVTLV